MYEQALAHLIEETKKGRMFGEWNDYGRLTDFNSKQWRNNGRTKD